MNNKSIANQQKIQLVNGRFTIGETEQLVHELAQAKIRHHMRRIENHCSSEEDIKAAECRIKAIETDVRALISQLRAIRPTSRLVDVDGLLTVQPVD